MKLSFLTYFLFLVSVTSFAQYDEDLSKVRPKVNFNENEVVVEEAAEVEITNHKNAEVELLLEEYAEYVAQIKCARGYRIQVYLGKSEKEVENIKEQLNKLEDFEEAEVYVEYEVNFRVKVGDYTNRLEAHQDLLKLQKGFPNALLLPESCIPLEKVK